MASLTTSRLFFSFFLVSWVSKIYEPAMTLVLDLYARHNAPNGINFSKHAATGCNGEFLNKQRKRNP